jgi:hypothetical protein
LNGIVTLIYFQEICNLCVENEAVLPSLMAFEKGVDLPTVYIIFYDYFFKSSVGDIRWKKACEDVKEHSDPLGSPQAEAFAMLQLKNN